MSPLGKQATLQMVWAGMVIVWLHWPSVRILSYQLPSSPSSTFPSLPSFPAYSPGPHKNVSIRQAGHTPDGLSRHGDSLDALPVSQNTIISTTIITLINLSLPSFPAYSPGPHKNVSIRQAGHSPDGLSRHGDSLAALPVSQNTIISTTIITLINLSLPP